MSYKLNTIILVADSYQHTKENVSNIAKTLEKPSVEYVTNLITALNQHAKNVLLCESPKQLALILKKQQVDLVMTIYGGEGSRNRMALVPAVCESFNTRFMGADVYNRVICQDKNLSKKIARDLGIKSPLSISIEDLIDINYIKTISLPLVVKPNFEGSSIGISNNSLVHTYEEAVQLVKESLKLFNQPILVEEFIPGQEVNITIIGSPDKIDIFEVVEDIMIENDNFFNDNLFSLENKKLLRDKFSHKIITDSFDKETKEKIIKLYQKFGKMDYMRIDGKIYNNEFILIELTPDPHLGINSGFTKACKHNNYNYDGTISLLIESSLRYYQTQYASVQDY